MLFLFSCAGNWTLLWYAELESLSGKVPDLKREICSSLTQQYIISNPNHPRHLNVNHSKSKLSCVWAYGLEQCSAGLCSACAASSSRAGGEGWQGAAAALLQGCSVAPRNLDGGDTRTAAGHQTAWGAQGEAARYLRSCSTPSPLGWSVSHCPSYVEPSLKHIFPQPLRKPLLHSPS